MRLALVMSLMMSARVPWDEMWDQGSERETEDAVKGWLPTSPPIANCLWLGSRRHRHRAVRGCLSLGIVFLVRGLRMSYNQEGGPTFFSSSGLLFCKQRCSLSPTHFRFSGGSGPTRDKEMGTNGKSLVARGPEGMSPGIRLLAP